jgi:hypothetical protein
MEDEQCMYCLCLLFAKELTGDVAANFVMERNIRHYNIDIRDPLRILMNSVLNPPLIKLVDFQIIAAVAVLRRRTQG